MAHRLLRGGRGKKLARLAFLLRNRKDKLRADFQQYYGLNLDGMGSDYTVLHAADLAANLPRDSRCGVADDPLNEWTTELCLLALIEHHLHEWNWAHSKASSDESTRPRLLIPIPEKDGDDGQSVRMGVDEMMEFVGSLIAENGGEDG